MTHSPGLEARRIENHVVYVALFHVSLNFFFGKLTEIQTASSLFLKKFTKEETIDSPVSVWFLLVKVISVMWPRIHRFPQRELCGEGFEFKVST